MQIATWNVNSIRSRITHVTQWLQDHPVDVLCLQETKVIDPDFPLQPLAALGYHIYISGQKAYNGVAILSRKPLESCTTGFAAILGKTDLDAQKRVITGIVDGVRIVNLYVPNGSTVGSDKYYYKLEWLQTLKEYLATILPTPMVICGDFNIALEDRDIYKQPDNHDNLIMASPKERQALQEIIQLGLADAFRKFTPDGGHFSWWDYRTGAFHRNRGWRIDHHYLTAELYQQATSCIIDTTPRKLEKPSDHAPVILTL
ncbi:exodeoxyribonuclease III [Merismopedia glauca]|uniref:Exodeoxyribonuclease III n=1 Tax=Merismopedia glauca CCAP 1448/3 TaxID=1296344 RepID=A0A2T1C416_9CYAN|nr:exodeoxyribonuclease III [Merismopedia glauca]PSB03022.1 exodeoxyribonuclease III [Merismopedia glauca CCAP 1448/3]